jgi:hypothetical protein
VPLALVLCWSLFAIKGLPMTHDGMGIVFIEAYRRAYHAGDYFPIWTVFGENAHGSPLLILYHRLHAQLAAVLALWTGTVVALKASIPFWLTIGGMGMRRLCRFHGARPWVAWIAGVMLMAANYALADWYIRGATAEFVGFMLVPWGLRYAYELFDRRWGGVRLAVIAALLFYAHMMTFYFFVVTAVVILTPTLLRRCAGGWPSFRAALARSIACGLLLTLAIGPLAAAVLYTSEFCGIGRFGMISHPDPWGAYLADRATISWSRTVAEGQMSLEIGRWSVLCLGVFLLVSRVARAAVWQRTGVLVVLTIGYVLLQHVGMGFWFDLLPGASKLQFPARLLVFIVTATLLCTAIATEGALRSSVPLVRLVACVLPLVAAACQVNITRGDQSAIWGNNIERSVADTALADDSNILAKKLSMNTAWVEYLPHMHGGNPPIQPFLKTSPGCHIFSVGMTQGVPVDEVSKNVAGSLTFTVVGKDCTVTYNQVQSVLTRVELSKPGAMRQTNDGMTLIDAPVDGTVVRIHDRSVMDLAKKFLIEKLRRRP